MSNAISNVKKIIIAINSLSLAIYHNNNMPNPKALPGRLKTILKTLIERLKLQRVLQL